MALFAILFNKQYFLLPHRLPLATVLYQKKTLFVKCFLFSLHTRFNVSNLA